MNSDSGKYYNSSTTYITLPAGTSYINIHGAVASNMNAGNGDVSKNTHIEFATGNDFIFARLH